MSRPSPFLPEARFGYDLADGGIEKYYRLSFDNLSTQNFVLASTTEFQRLNDAFGDGTTRFTLDDLSTARYIGSDPTLTLLHEGNDTDFDRIYQMQVPLDVWVDRITFNIGAGMNVSAYSSGNFALNSFMIDMASFKAQGQQLWSGRQHYTTTLVNMVAVDNQVAILNRTFNTGFPLYRGGLFVMQINMGATVGTGTYQKGVLATFPDQATGAQRPYNESGFSMHMRVLPSQGELNVPVSVADSGPYQAQSYELMKANDQVLKELQPKY